MTYYSNSWQGFLRPQGLHVIYHLLVHVMTWCPGLWSLWWHSPGSRALDTCTVTWNGSGFSRVPFGSSFLISLKLSAFVVITPNCWASLMACLLLIFHTALGHNLLYRLIQLNLGLLPWAAIVRQPIDISLAYQCFFPPLSSPLFFFSL